MLMFVGLAIILSAPFVLVNSLIKTYSVRKEKKETLLRAQRWDRLKKEYKTDNNLSDYELTTTYHVHVREIKKMYDLRYGDWGQKCS